MGALSTTTPDGIEVFFSEIHAALNDYITDARAEDETFDMRKASQSRWNAALLYIYYNVFKGTTKLRMKPYDSSNNLNHGNLTNNNAYDIDLLNIIADYYIDLCYEYEKEVSLMGFCKLTGIKIDCIYGWAGNSGYSEGLTNRASPSGVELFKKLSKEREESLSGKLATGNKNPVGILAILNRHFAWNLPGVTKEQKQVQGRTPEQIEQQYGKEAQKTLPPPPED